MATTLEPGNGPRTKLGKLFHLTPLVDSLPAAEYFFNSVFSPLCMMRNYSSHWHRHAAIYIIGETSIEPMECLPPPDGEVGTSWYRFVDRYGPRVHNMAFYIDNRDELDRRLNQAGIRTTDGGSPTTIFAHPKDTPGMVEFQHVGPDTHMSSDPRFSAHWKAFSTDYWTNLHPLGLERLSHITVAVEDLTAARSFFVDVLDGEPLPDQPARTEGTDAAFVLLGEDTVVEVAQPTDSSCRAARELEAGGQGVIGATFKVREISPRLRRHLEMHEAPILSVGDDSVVLDAKRTWNTEYRFTSEPLVGDPRA